MRKITILSVILCSLLFVMGCDGEDCEVCKPCKECEKCETCEECEKCEVCPEKPEPGNIQVGDTLPNFSVKLNNGELINRKSLEKKVSITLLFSVTCPDCKRLFPSIEQIYNEYKDNNKLVLLAISREEGEDVVGKFMKDNNYTFPYSPQETRDVYSLFAPSIVPRVYISNWDCIVQEMYIDDPIATYEELKSQIDDLLEILCCKL